MKRNWTNITLREYYKIKSFIEEPDEWTTFNILDLLYDTDSANMTVNEFSQYKDALAFLGEDVPKTEIPKQLTINGRVYDAHLDLTTVNVAQFVDYQNYIKESKFEDLLSVFMVPESHKYNDGYDIEQVKNDMLSIDFATVHTIAFFFVKQLELFLELFRYYLIQSIQTMKLPKKEKKQTIDSLRAMDFNSLVSYLTSSVTQKKHLLQLRKSLKSLSTSSSMS